MIKIMNDILTLLLALIVGAGLGVFFFGGLWWTIRNVITSKFVALWFLGGWLLRTAIVLLGFYVVSAGHLDRLAACLLGFLIARFVVLRVARSFFTEPLLHGKCLSSKESCQHAP